MLEKVFCCNLSYFAKIHLGVETFLALMTGEIFFFQIGHVDYQIIKNLMFIENY
jgi:hypothetical protein